VSGGKSRPREGMRLPTAEESYHLQSSAVPERIRTELESLQKKRRRRRVLEVRLDPGLGAPCWEAMIAGGTQPVSARLEPAGPRGLRVVRTLASRRARPVKEWRDLDSAISLVADLRQDEMATQGWQRLIRIRRYSHRILRGEEAFGGDQSGDEIDIVHIVATPIDTASGPRLDLGRLTGARSVSKQSGSPRGELMQPADVLSRFPDVVFCVLQATPQEHTDRTYAERRQAASLRSMAEEIFSLGLTAVVTIPPLPSSVAAVVLDGLAEAVTSRPGRLVAALTAAIEQAREKMAAMPAVGNEPAFDFAVYAAEVPAAVTSTPGGSGS
jgi:hypothetical protein